MYIILSITMSRLTIICAYASSGKSLKGRPLSKCPRKEALVKASFVNQWLCAGWGSSTRFAYVIYTLACLQICDYLVPQGKKILTGLDNSMFQKKTTKWV